MSFGWPTVYLPSYPIISDIFLKFLEILSLNWFVSFWDCSYIYFVVTIILFCLTCGEEKLCRTWESLQVFCPGLQFWHAWLIHYIYIYLYISSNSTLAALYITKYFLSSCQQSRSFIFVDQETYSKMSIDPEMEMIKRGRFTFRKFIFARKSFNFNFVMLSYCFVLDHSHKKRKMSLEGSLVRVFFADELELPKILVPMLPQNTSNVNTGSTGKSKQLYYLCDQLFQVLIYFHFIVLILTCF